MTTVVPIVEGHGEVAAVPELLRRVSTWCAPHKYIDVAPPIRTSRGKFLNDEVEFSKKLQLASLKAGSDGWVLVLLDADDDCPVTLRDHLLMKASEHVNPSNVSVVIANREYEAWFLAAAASLEGCRGFKQDATLNASNPDSPRNAKGLVSMQMLKGYHEVTDQPALTAAMDLSQAWTGSRSFQRFVSEFCRRGNFLA